MKEKLAKYTNLFLLGLVILLSISLVRNILKSAEAKKGIEAIKSRVVKLKGESSELETKLKEAQSYEYVEKQLRDSLGLAKKGEVVIILPEPEILKKLAPKLPEEEERLPDPIWKRWLKLFL